MTSNHVEHPPVFAKVTTQCPNLSLTGNSECQHCGDHNGVNDELKAQLAGLISARIQSNRDPESQRRSNTPDHSVYSNHTHTVHSTVPQNFTQTGSMGPAVMASAALMAATPVTSIELSKPKARGRPRLSTSTVQHRTNSLNKSAAVDTHRIDLEDGPLSNNRKRYAKPEPPSAPTIRPVIQTDLYFNGPFRFLDLPQHIRQLTYTYLLTDVGALNKQSFHQQPINRVNRQTRHETLYLLYALNPFHADHRDTCKTGPAFIRAIGDAKCRLIHRFIWYTAKRTLFLDIVPSANGYLSQVRGQGPQGPERAAEIQIYVQQCCSTVGFGLAEFEFVTQIVLRTTPREPKAPKEPKEPKAPKGSKELRTLPAV